MRSHVVNCESKSPAFHLHVTQEAKVENEYEFVGLKLKIYFSFSFNCS